MPYVMKCFTGKVKFFLHFFFKLILKTKLQGWVRLWVRGQAVSFCQPAHSGALALYLNKRHANMQEL